ncbi:MAG: hypothetical protein J5I81_09700 [Nitrococcus mobilis]|nr:hypothetical protein [Nitrococcus mobilis]
MAVNYGSLPFSEQIAFFRRKLNLPTESWTDIFGAEHDHAFVVAGANRDDLVADFRAAVDKAISEGTTLAEFRKDFDAIVARHGWSYNGGRGWRSRVIYDTNLRTSYAAGRYAQLQSVKTRRPYWRYRHSIAVTDPRPQHLSWDGLVLEADDPWWQAHYPPNGWGCQCFIESLAARDLRRLGKDGPDTAPPIVYQTRTVGSRGPTPRTVRVPEGIDPGFAHAPGASAANTAMRLYMDHAAALPPEIAALGALSVLSRERLLEALETDYRDWIDGLRQTNRSAGELRVLGVIRPATLSALLARGLEPNTAGIVLRDADFLHLQRPTKRSRRTRTGLEKALTDEDINRLPRILAEPAAVLRDTRDGSLIYVFDSSGARGTGKLVVRIDFAAKVRDAQGKPITKLFNVIRSGGQVEVLDLDQPRYELLEGAL